MYPLVLASDSIQALQCLLLMVRSAQFIGARAHKGSRDSFSLQGQYLQSTSQPNLCWNTVGNAVRFAQGQGLYLPSTTANMDPVEAEIRRRAWAGVVILESTSSATLGLPPSLSPEESSAVSPAAIDDDLITRNSRGPQPEHRPSSASFFVETFKLLIIQTRVLRALYSSISVSTSTWPNVHAILNADRDLADWEACLPEHLVQSARGAQMRQGNRELQMQFNVLRARSHNVRMLVHRPLLFHLCQRGAPGDILASAPSLLDRRIAKSSAQICCTTATELIELIVQNWEDSLIGAWCMCSPGMVCSAY
jgi:Fungal specific transcription factor domain